MWLRHERLKLLSLLPQRAKKENAKLREQLEKQKLQKEREVGSWCCRLNS